MLLCGHLALLVNHELFGISAVDADELQATLAFVDTIEFAWSSEGVH